MYQQKALQDDSTGQMLFKPTLVSKNSYRQRTYTETVNSLMRKGIEMKQKKIRRQSAKDPNMRNPKLTKITAEMERKVAEYRATHPLHEHRRMLQIALENRNSPNIKSSSPSPKITKFDIQSFLRRNKLAVWHLYSQIHQQFPQNCTDMTTSQMTHMFQTANWR